MRDAATGTETLLPGAPGTIRFTDLPDRHKTVEIWLPHNETAELIALRSDHPMEGCPITRPIWLHHGSSISHGSNALHPTDTPSLRSSSSPPCAVPSTNTLLDRWRPISRAAQCLSSQLAIPRRPRPESSHSASSVTNSRPSSNSDPNIHYLDGLTLYGPADFAEFPLADRLHPGPQAHQRIGRRFADAIREMHLERPDGHRQ